MTDLYQQAPGSKGYGPQDWEVVRRMAPGAMLLWVVPVEPDYEAAERAIDMMEVFTASDSKPGIRMIERSQSEVARLAVDAALGVGEETP